MRQQLDLVREQGGEKDENVTGTEWDRETKGWEQQVALTVGVIPVLAFRAEHHKHRGKLLRVIVTMLQRPARYP